MKLLNRDLGRHSSNALKRVAILGFVSWIVYLWLLSSSFAFSFGESATTRPIPWFVGVMGVLFGIQMLATWVAIGCRDQDGIWKLSMIFGLGFRLVIIFSEPIQELDYYRYLWDGHCTSSGVSPYQYSPADVQRASAHDESLSLELRQLAKQRDADPVLATILGRIHFEELPTIYPPVSQVVFAASALTAPRGASIATRVVVLKSWIVAFDVGTFVVLILLLRHVGYSYGWAMVYGWSPLVVKEFANSGHLDAIAVFFCVLAIYALIRGVYPAAIPPAKTQQSSPVPWLVVSSLALSLAIGSKLYPVILAPLFVFTVWHRFGVWKALKVSSLTIVVTAVVCSPMLERPRTVSRPEVISLPDELSTSDENLPRPANSSADSLRVFLTQWKMNDLIFLCVESNVAPKNKESPNDPWFVLTTRQFRHELVDEWSRWFNVDPKLFPFLLTRTLLTLLFLGLAIRWAAEGASSTSPQAWLKCAFLTLAWFWALSPTLNPWYWIWALPLVPFSGRRAWYIVGGLLPIYYLRFWFVYHWPSSEVALTPYFGADFFDFVVVWIEHGIWLSLLLWESWNSSNECSASQTKAVR